MLKDFAAIERLFGRGEAILFIEDVLEHYSEGDLFFAIRCGYLVSHSICFGPDCGRHVCWLSEEGRTLVSRSLNNTIPEGKELIESCA